MGVEAPRGGLKFLQDLMAGAGSAPLGLKLDFRLEDVGDGYAVFRGVPGEDHYNPAGVVHGGWTAAVLDSALGCAIQTMLDSDDGYSTIELKVNYIRSMTADTGPVTCRGKVVHIGRRMATSEARLVDGTGKLLAHGSCTCMIHRGTE